MSEKYNWSVPLTKLLILEYKANEMLYNTKHPDYKNRNKRMATYKKISDIINAEQEGCSSNDIKKKLNGLRSQYLAEKIKVARSQKSGAGADCVYTPTVYWYPLFKFLDSTTNVDTTVSNIDYENDTFEENDTDVNITRPLQRSDTEIRKRKANEDYDNLLAKATRTVAEISKLAKAPNSDDDVTTFGKFIVCELRGIVAAGDQIIYRQAKRKIQEVLMNTWDIIDNTPCSSTRTSYLTDTNTSQWVAQIVDDSSSLNIKIEDDYNEGM